MKMMRKKVFCLNILVIVTFVFSDSVQGSVTCDLETKYLCNDKETCISKNYICNGIVDCPDKDDEIDCEIGKCEDKEKFFKCRNNINCVGKGVICDGEADCPDASDESDEMCDPIVLSSDKCDSDEFRCGNNVCIPLNEICNGAQNCLDGSDEDPKMCSNHKCQGNHMCPNGRCLELKLSEIECDGVDDCGDGSDEAHCAKDCQLKDNKFLCKSGDECIDFKLVCDGITNCLDKSDEGEQCGEKDACKSLNCGEAECKILPTGPECVCEKGFEYNLEKKQCEDIDECKIYGICSHGCTNQNGSYYCSCAKGFLLNKDGRSCDTTSNDVELVYTTRSSVKKVDIGQKGSMFHNIVSNARQPVGVAFDGVNYYWTEVEMGREVLVKYPANERNPKKEILLTNGLELPEYIAVDWVTKNIYFTDSMRAHVAVCTNNGYYCTELVKIKQMQYPRAIALHPLESLLFWSDWGNNSHIGVSYMDGTNASILVDNVSWPNGLALDWPNGRLYWIDAFTKTIESIKITGHDRKTILESVVKHPFALEVFGNTLYWCDHGTNSIETCDKFTGKNHKVIVQGQEIFDVHIYDKAAMPAIKNPCSDNPCSHICLLSSHNSYSCACPMDMEMSSDLHNCRPISQYYTIYLGIGPYLLPRPYQAFGKNVEVASHRVDSWIDQMEYNKLSGDLFYANNEDHELYLLDSQHTNHLLLKDPNLRIDSMSFDYYGNNLYWVDSHKNTIEILSLTTKKHAIIQHFRGLDSPTAIVVIPAMGEMFIAAKSFFHSHIDRHSMKGDMTEDNHHHIIESGLSWDKPIYLAIDESEMKLYWSNSGKKKIEFSNFDGTGRKIFAKTDKRPGPLALVGNEIHWTSEKSKSLQWRNKNGDGPIKITRLDNVKGLSSDDYPSTISIVSGGPIKMKNHPCTINNGNCSDICVSDGPHKRVCKCAIGFVFKDKANTICVERSICDFRCGSGECIEAKMLCDGNIDCTDRSDESDEKCKKPWCKVDQFKCDNGQCIPFEQKCDKNFNCDDRSDEKDCKTDDPENICKLSHQINCPNSSVCIYKTQLCDQRQDCPDGFDESIENCNRNCLENEFKCTSGQCIPKQFECDSRIDCIDGSDEHDGCVQMCEPPKKPCRNGFCIHEKFFCDGHDDCGDNYDELNCKYTEANSCDLGEFQCISDPNICILPNKRCDGKADCPKGEDEKHCPKCPLYQFECDNGHCIDMNLKCDGKSDCKDHSDEKDCSEQPKDEVICNPNSFKCSDGTCLPYNKVCNGHRDCDDDEGSGCEQACVGRVCSQKCYKTPKGSVCDCEAGYKLLSKGDKFCADIDECKDLVSSPCSQICENTVGSYTCKCYEGYITTLNNAECKALGNSQKILYALHNEIRSVSNSMDKDLLYEADSAIGDLAVDVEKNLLMFSLIDQDGLFLLDMKTREERYLENIPHPQLFAFDWITKNVYIVTRRAYYQPLEIQSCHIYSQKCVLIQKLEKQRHHITSIDIDPINKFIFYVKLSHTINTKKVTEIVRIKLDGSDLQTIFTDSSQNEVKALAVDFNSESIYFVEAFSQSLQRIDYRGTNTSRATYVHQSRLLKNPLALSLFESYAYVMDQASSKISRCKLYDDNRCEILDIDTASSSRFIIVQESKQMKRVNYCENHACEEMCINADFGKKCLCSNGNKTAAMCSEVISKSGSRRGGNHTWIWILFFILVVLACALVAYYTYKRNGFNYNMNINYNKSFGTRIDAEADKIPIIVTPPGIPPVFTPTTTDQRASETENHPSTYPNIDAFQNLEGFSDDEDFHNCNDQKRLI